MPLRDQFLLDPDVTYLTHGTFGACPRPVLEDYQRWQRELEREPVQFLDRRLDGLLLEVREALGAYLGARAGDLAFVPNATTGMNTVARSLGLGPDDEVLTTDHEYGAVTYAWEATGARVVRGRRSSRPGSTRLRGRASSRSRTSPRPPRSSSRSRSTAAARGSWGSCRSSTAPTRPARFRSISRRSAPTPTRATATSGLGAPKGAGFLWVRPELQERIRPLVVSWGWPEDDFVARHAWQGTRDPAAWLAIPAAIEFQREWGWDEVRARCRALVERFVEASGLEPVGRPFAQMASVELPSCDPVEVQRGLWDDHRIEVPSFDWQGRPLLRISVQGYNDEADVDRLVGALAALFPGA